MQDIIKGDPHVMEKLDKLCTGKNAIQHTLDSFGNAFNWYLLDEPALVLDAAKILHAAGARLAMISAYNTPGNDRNYQNCCYEFVLGGTVYNTTAHMDAEHPSVPSITPIFANADWHEREMMELFGIKITGHPNPRRLFLDEELDKGMLARTVPLSVMMNGASSSELWEMILSDKGEKA